MLLLFQTAEPAGDLTSQRIKLIVLGLMAVASALALLTAWYWRVTDPKARSATQPAEPTTEDRYVEVSESRRERSARKKQDRADARAASDQAAETPDEYGSSAYDPFDPQPDDSSGAGPEGGMTVTQTQGAPLHDGSQSIPPARSQAATTAPHPDAQRPDVQHPDVQRRAANPEIDVRAQQPEVPAGPPRRAAALPPRPEPAPIRIDLRDDVEAIGDPELVEPTLDLREQAAASVPRRSRQRSMSTGGRSKSNEGLSVDEWLALQGDDNE